MKKLIVLVLLSFAAVGSGNAQAPQARPGKRAQTIQQKQTAKPATAKPAPAATTATTATNQQLKDLDKSFDQGWAFVSFWGLVVFGVFFTGALAWTAFKYFFLRGDPKGDEHGTAAFATTEELLQLGILRKLKSKLLPGEFHMGIYRAGKRLIGTVYFAALLLETAKGHCLVAGATNSGKTYTILLPNIVKAHKTEESLFITDVKRRNRYGELWEMSSGHRPNAIYFSPLEPELNELKFNIIPALKGDELRATAWAKAVIDTGGEESHWESSAVQLLMSVWFHAATMPRPNLNSAQDVLMQEVELLKETLANSPSPEARTSGRQFLDAAEKEASSILSTCRKSTAFMNSKAIRIFCDTDTATDFTAMRRESTSIYYQARITRASAIKGLNSLIFTYMTEQLLEENGLPVKFLLDEFANFGKIPDFQNKITTFRSAGLYITAVLQSVSSQMETNYGRTETATILNSFNTQIALPGLNHADAKMVSDQIGIMTELSRSASSGIGNPIDGNNSISSHARQLLTPDQVTTLPKKAVLIFRSGNEKPFILERENYNFKEKTREIAIKPLYTVPPAELPKPSPKDDDEEVQRSEQTRKLQSAALPDWA
jgi:type IV secretory pathway TraG/TraD family ATPase VirD4